MVRKTKVICTLGPATDDDKVLRELMLGGMNAARFNFSHAEHAYHKRNMERVVKLREELNLPIATLLDTKGPEIRIGKFKEGKVFLSKGELFTLTTREIDGSAEACTVTYKDLPGDVFPVLPFFWMMA